jgi:hypothetical protein
MRFATKLIVLFYPRNMRNVSWQVVTVLVLAVLLIGGAYYLNSQNTKPRDGGQMVPGIGGGPPTNEESLISDIVQNPSRHVGESVTVQGEIDRVLSPRIFVLDREGTAIGDELLVVARAQIPSEAKRDINNPLQNADKVTVSGTVRMLLIEDIEQEIGSDLNQAVEIEFEGKPFIMATDVTIATPTPR